MNRCMWSFLGVLVIFTSFLPQGRAQQGNGLDFERFRPALDSHGLLTVEGGEGEACRQLHLGMVLNYERNPLVVGGNRTGDHDLVSDRVGGDLFLSLGLVDWLSVGLDLPVIFTQAGRSVDPSSEGEGNFSSSLEIQDVWFVPKATLLRNAKHNLSLALLLPISVPSGNADHYAGERDSYLSSAPTVALSYALPRHGLLFAFNLGVWIRNEASYLALRTGNELFAKVGAGYQFLEHFQGMLEINWATSLREPYQYANQSPAETLLGVRYATPVQGLSALLGAGFGLGKGWGAPDFRVFLGASYTLPSIGACGQGQACEAPASSAAKPAPIDKDDDGLLDRVDRCPDQAGPAENVGCPVENKPAEPIASDQGQDSVPASLSVDVPEETEEKEPLVELSDDSASTDDPPKKEIVIIRDKTIELTEKIHFTSGNAMVLSDSLPILDRVAEILNEHREIKKVRIEGHTDSAGSAATNQKLSRERAKSVQQYLVEKGVSPERLDHDGLGSSQPIASNKTSVGRESNRRVEIVIVERE